MNFRALISFVAGCTLLLSALVSGPGCANIIPPEGGPRDSLAPILIKATPKDSLLNFTGNRISFLFDEYVEVDNYQQNLIISPVPENMPSVTRKLETISVRLKDSLEPNTTYTLNFGRSIKDLNEGNVFRDFTYIFSTGNYFDSLQFRGNVLLAETGDVDTTITVLLHRSPNDSALINEKPRYISRVDRKGNFHFINLAPGTYYPYALKDESGRYRYLNTEQLFAFSDSAVVINEETKPLTLFAYATQAEKPEPIAEGRKTTADKRLKFTINLQGTDQDLLTRFAFNFELPLRDFDSSKIRFVTDSSFVPVTDAYSWERDSTRKKVTLNYTWKESTLYHFILQKDFATDTLGQQLLKADTISFTSKKTTDYGKLTLRFRNLDLASNPVLQFVQNNDLKNSFPLTSANFTQNLFIPGEYNLRILADANKNGKWDPGEFYGKRKQPELVKPITRKITVKANQDIPIEIDVTAPPAPAKDEVPIPGRGQAPAGQGRPVNRPRLNNNNQ